MSELTISALIDALRSVSVPVVPFEHQWFDLEQLAAYLHYEKSHVQQRVIGLPGFPLAVKCGTGFGLIHFLNYLFCHIDL